MYVYCNEYATIYIYYIYICMNTSVCVYIYIQRYMCYDRFPIKRRKSLLAEDKPCLSAGLDCGQVGELGQGGDEGVALGVHVKPCCNPERVIVGAPVR